MPRLLAASLLFFGVLLSACSSRYSAPVDDLDETPRFVDSGRTHRVNDGETLYVVAWMYDLDFAALARANNLREPYAIAPGQILSVDLRGTPQTQRGVVGTATTTAVAVTTGIQRAPLESTPITRQALPPAAPASQGVPESQTPASTPPPASTEPLPARTLPPPAATTPEVEPSPLPPLAEEPIRWDWPARGNIIGRYSSTDPDGKGIKLGGSEGETVMAAADGEVVYAGNGLLRYGELVILKHNERFLSAYAHNKVITVKEGDRVTRGQQIAHLGSTGIDRDMLHFEIRQDGKPVDPLQYLPPR